MTVTRITDKLVEVAEARAKRSPDGTGFARTKNQSVRYTECGPLGLPMLESVRFIESPMLGDPAEFEAALKGDSDAD